MSPRPENQGLGGPSSRVSPCSALLCFAALPCFTGFCSFALWLVDPLVLLLFCFLCSFFCLRACLLACLFPCLLARWLAGLLDCLLAWKLATSILFSSAATCSHSSGRKWPPAFSFHRQPLAPTCSQSSGRKWPPEQVAASGRQSKWPQVAAFAKIKFVPFCTLSGTFGESWRTWGVLTF